MRKIILNGKNFIKKNKRGSQRYTCEIIKALDKYVHDMNVELVIPNVECNIPDFKNIKIIKYGKKNILKGWQYIFFQWYCLKEKGIAISLSPDGAPLIKPGIVAVFDIRFTEEKKCVNNFKSFLRNKYNLFINYNILKRATKIITISNFSKSRIEKYYKCLPERIEIIYCGWEHLKDIKISSKIKDAYINKDFYFCLGGMEKNKNLKWVYEVAKQNSNELFLIAGPPISKYNVIDSSINIENNSNIKHLGYISNEEIAYFMKNCKAFLFPSLYEGFGIPPLEALYFGARVLCSNSTCLPGIYKDYVTYFDPYDYDVDLDKLLEKPVNKSDEIFKLYSWNRGAKQLLNIIKQYQ